MELKDAERIANKIKTALAPHCDRIEIAGSIRRKKFDVGDIEIVCIPKSTVVETEDDFFGRGDPAGRPPTRTARSAAFIAAASSLGTLVKGSIVDGKAFQIVHAHRIKLDIFTATPDNWGYIFAIRTGSAAFSHEYLAKGWRGKFMYGDNGTLRNTETGAPIIVREEEDLFRLIKKPFVKPENRW